jgi:hypothetical protein
VRSTAAPDPSRRRDPVNESYHRGCDLVEAAMAIRLLAPADIGPAVPALLACIECALDELAHASAAVRTPAAELAWLSDALTCARDRAAAAREAASRATALEDDEAGRRAAGRAPGLHDGSAGGQARHEQRPGQAR